MAMSAVPVPDSPESDPETQIETRPDSDDEQRDDEDRDGGGGRMSFLDHLDELRRRLITSVSAIFIAFVAAYFFHEEITAFIMVPLFEILPEVEGRERGFSIIDPTEGFFLSIKVAALVGLILAMPVVLTQFWLFVAPGLYAHEKRFAIPFVSLSTLFFTGGCLFSHYLLFRVAWLFLGSFSTDYVTFTPRIQPTFSLYVRLMLACGVVFQMPTVVFFLARIGLLTARYLIRNTKYAILIIFIIAAVMTPTGDPATLTMMAAPMTVLYGVSIGIAWLVAPRRKDGDDL
jgi:sec-independent protein translocase protein TatC